MEKRQERDSRYLAALEEVTQKLWQCKEKYNLLEEENYPAVRRLKDLEEKLTTERRLLEEVSLPCRFILEHFTTFMGKSDHTVGFSLGQQLELGRGSINDFSIKEWGNVCLVIGNVHLCWRDQDYQYLFYPDKVVLRSVDRSKPEIHLFFNFAFKYSKILDEFRDVSTDKQTLYCYPDLFEDR
jgi:hypothetical protein